MQTEKIKAGIAWLLSAICMAVIFWLSLKNAQVSNNQSLSVFDWLSRLFGDGVFTHIFVRKLAHFIEFAGLCFLLNIALYYSKGTMPMLSVVLTSAYAAADEIHQHFVEGRACQFIDWAMDTTGAVFGSLCFLLLIAAISAVLKKKSIDTIAI